MNRFKGDCKENPIRIKKNKINKSLDSCYAAELEKIFGDKPDEYFIISCREVEKNRKDKFVIYCVEDKNNLKHLVYFLVLDD